MSDRDRLKAALSEHLEVFGRRRWSTATIHWERSGLTFLHAKRQENGELDEVMVVARIQNGGHIRVRRYVLLHREREWMTCDQAALGGFLEEGPPGLKQGSARTKLTICACARNRYRSAARARSAARGMAEQHKATGCQRSYRCSENPRAFHLTAQQKGSQAPIPGAYIDLTAGQERGPRDRAE